MKPTLWKAKNRGKLSCEMASKWHGKPCPLCNEGTLRDGKLKRQLEHRGRIFESTVKVAFCNHCADGFPDHDEREEAAWLAFRDRVDCGGHGRLDSHRGGIS